MNCFEMGSLDRDAGVICAKLRSDYGAKADDVSDPQKVYRRAVQEAVAEAKSNFLRPSSYYPFLKFLRDKAQMTVPFIFEDLDPHRRVDENLLRAISARRSLLTRAADYHRFLTAADQLGIRFDANAIGSPTPHALDAVEAKKGNCLSFVLLEYGISLLLGQSMRIYDQVDLPQKAHVLISLGSDYLDPEDGILPVAPRSQALVEISFMDLIAYFHYNQALSELCQKGETRQGETCQELELLKAQRYAPRNFRVQYALAHFYFHTKKDIEKARLHFERYREAIKHGSPR